MIRFPLVFSCGMIAFMIFSATQCKTKVDDDYPPPAPYTPSFTATGTKYTAPGGSSVIEFVLTCTTDAISVTSVDLSGPFGTTSVDGGGQQFNMNQPFYISNPDIFFWTEGKYSFTIKGIIRSEAHSGESFVKTTYWELIIP